MRGKRIHKKKQQDFTNDILLPNLYCKKNYTRRYHRLGNIQTSLDTPHSKLSLYKNYNTRYPRLEEYRDWSEYSPVWGIFFFIER